MAKKGLHKKKLKPVFLILMGFIVIILLGSVLLYLPFTHHEGVTVSFLDALFMSTSATCVTGLFTVPQGLAGTFNSYGYFIVAVMIQLGGLGAGVVGVFVFIIISKRLSFDKQTIIKESWNISDNKNLRKVFALVFVMTAIYEVAGAILIFIDFYFLHPELYGGDVVRAITASIFTSISAFNNAGFDLFGTNSLMAFQSDYYLLSVLAVLIICGGLGYMVQLDIIKKRFRWNKFSLQSKMVLFMTLILIVGGGLAIFTSENIGTKSVYSVGHQNMDFFNAIFLSISCRTAGFSTFNLAETKSATMIIMMILMIIGASPGGTGGGMKTTTFYVVILSFISLFTKKDPHAFRRNISKKALSKSSLIFLAYLLLVIVSIIIVTILEGEQAYLVDGVITTSFTSTGVQYSTTDHLFEICSALGTVGLGTGYTIYYSIGTKIILMFLMYFGRTGPLTMSQMFYQKEPTWHYVEDEITIG